MSISPILSAKVESKMIVSKTAGIAYRKIRGFTFDKIRCQLAVELNTIALSANQNLKDFDITNMFPIQTVLEQFRRCILSSVRV